MHKQLTKKQRLTCFEGTTWSQSQQNKMPWFYFFQYKVGKKGMVLGELLAVLSAGTKDKKSHLHFKTAICFSVNKIGELQLFEKKHSTSSVCPLRQLLVSVESTLPRTVEHQQESESSPHKGLKNLFFFINNWLQCRTQRFGFEPWVKGGELVLETASEKPEFLIAHGTKPGKIGITGKEKQSLYLPNRWRMMMKPPAKWRTQKKKKIIKKE